MGSTSAGGQYTVERTSSSDGGFYVVVDAEGHQPSGFGHALERDAQREADELNGERVGQRRVAVQCHDGCGYRSYRTYPGPEKPCPRCGAPVDVGIPTRPAMRTKQGGIGGRTQLIWGPWS